MKTEKSEKELSMTNTTKANDKLKEIISNLETKQHKPMAKMPENISIIKINPPTQNTKSAFQKKPSVETKQM